MLDHAAVTQHADTPGLSVPVERLFQRLAVPPGTDARALSPLYAEDLGGLAPALVVVPTHDPMADHGRRYAERLGAAGTSVRLSEYPGAGHAFLSTSGLEPQAETARQRSSPSYRPSSGLEMTANKIDGAALDGVTASCAADRTGVVAKDTSGETGRPPALGGSAC
jgi:acetyl esterase/lipase